MIGKVFICLNIFLWEELSGAYLMYVITTFSVAYITRMDDFDCGMMMNASHNPYDHNGIKILNHLCENIEKFIHYVLE